VSARRYVITGAASGIGRSVAGLAADEGAALCLVDRDASGLRGVADEVSDRATGVSVVEADLADAAAPGEVIAKATAALGGLDAVVSNAGAPIVASLLELTLEGFEQTTALNTRATWLLGKAAHPWLAQSGGAIVATASICGHHPAPPLAGYSVAKAGLLMLVRQMALEWGPDGIRVNSVSPGPTVTGLTAGIFNDMDDPAERAMRERREAVLPLRKVGLAREVAEAIYFLSGPRASQITGIDILVDGGMGQVLMPTSGGGARHQE
jgi:NAD(P)-dependent dehydrogenase (short-subunit alcohol dehydrogenase family)